MWLNINRRLLSTFLKINHPSSAHSHTTTPAHTLAQNVVCAHILEGPSEFFLVPFPFSSYLFYFFCYYCPQYAYNNNTPPPKRKKRILSTCASIPTPQYRTPPLFKPWINYSTSASNSIKFLLARSL